MLLVADTSPLNYLIQIDCVHLLPALYGKILLPGGVLQELRAPGSPMVVSVWANNLPNWAVVVHLKSVPDASLRYLDLGEREAIQIAQEEHAALLLMDDRKGCREAERRGLIAAGTLGVLLEAEHNGLINAKIAHQRLITTTNFRSSARLNALFLSRARTSQ